MKTGIIGSIARVLEWQTGQSQKLVVAIPCEFDSHLGHFDRDQKPVVATGII